MMYGQPTVEQILAKVHEGLGCYVKYVRVGDTFRFCGFMENHSSLLQDGEVPTSAAAVGINETGIRVRESSMLLKIGPADDDSERLSKLFNLPIKAR